MSKSTVIRGKQLLPFLAVFSFLIFIIFQGCQKNIGKPDNEMSANSQAGKKPHNPPPPPPAFSYNCGLATPSGSFVVGVPTNATITFNYSNSPGGSHGGYTSQTLNGITWSTAPGTLNVGSGTITYTASGTPASAGQVMSIVSLNNFPNVGCGFVWSALNPPSNCTTTSDPGPTFGSTGCVVFNYRGQQVSYKTVRAKDGKVWLQQNLGSPQVAYGVADEASFGDYFQWGRWDDGHQKPNSTTVAGGPSLSNPSHIASGYSNFIVGTTPQTQWWGTGGLSSDTWSGTSATSTNGKDPCVALGAGWHLPTSADWQNLKSHEDLEGALTAYMSNLKLPAAGNRDGYGGFVFKGGESYYWSATPSNAYAIGLFISDNTYSATLQASERSQGMSCRCVKD